MLAVRGRNARKSCCPSTIPADSASFSSSSGLAIHQTGAASNGDEVRRCQIRYRYVRERAVFVRAIVSLLGGDHRDVVGEHRVQRLSDALQRRASLDRQANDLAKRVNARVGSSRDYEMLTAAEHGVDGLPNNPGDGALTWLCRPAGEVGPVVLERQLYVHGSNCTTRSSAVATRTRAGQARPLRLRGACASGCLRPRRGAPGPEASARSRRTRGTPSVPSRPQRGPILTTRV